MNSEVIFSKKTIWVLIACSLIFILNFNAFSQTNPGDFTNITSITQELQVPVRTAIDNKGNIYVTDENQKCIVQYDSLLNFVGKIFVGDDPISIAISDDNTMFIGDYRNGKIYKRLSSGAVSLIYADTIYPSSMVVSPINELYVVDSWSKQVLVLDFGGNVIRTIGAGIFLFPTGIAFDSKNNTVIVAEHGGFGNGFNLHTEIRIFEAAGTLISTFGGWGNTAGKFYRIQDLAIGRCGNIYVTDPYQGQISVFDAAGNYITKFGIWGDSLGQLNVTMDLAFDSHERIFVVSLNNSALEIFNITDSLPSSTITSGTASICSGDSTTIAFSFTGTAPWTFTYTVDGINPQTVVNTFTNPYLLTVSTAGAYNVTALSDSSHTGTCFNNTAVVIINPTPTSSITSVNPSICAGESINIPIAFTGNAPYSFTYTIDGLNPTTITDVYANPYNLIATQDGTYQITALTANNCEGTIFTGSETVTINVAPVATVLTPVAFICPGTSAAIQIALTGNAPWTITYTIDGQNPVTETNITTNPYFLYAALPGTYEITSLTDANCAGLSFNGSAIIVENQLPVATFVSGNSAICANDSAIIAIELQGSAPWSLTYTINGLNPTTISGINVLTYSFYTQQPGVYEVVQLSDYNCSGIAFNGSSIVSINPLPVVNLGADTAICDGQSLTLSGGLNDFYLWSDFSTNQTLTISTAGNYGLTITDINGCQNADEILVSVTPNPLAAFNYTASNLEITFTNNSTNATTYFWSFGDGITDTNASPVHLYAASGVYVVTLISTSLTCGTDTIIDTLNVVATGIEDVNSGISLSVFPNPSHGIFTLNINNPKGTELKVSIFNAVGQTVYYKELNSIKSSEQIDISNRAVGVYTIRLVSNQMTKIVKLILTD